MRLKYPPKVRQENFLDFLRKPETMLYGHLKTHPDIFYFKILNRKAYFIQEPEFAKTILQDNNRSFGKSRAFATLSVLLGNGLLTSEGAFWKRQRRLAQPAFHKKRLELIAEIAAESTKEILDTWVTKNEVFDVMGEMASLRIHWSINQNVLSILKEKEQKSTCIFLLAVGQECVLEIILP